MIATREQLDKLLHDLGEYARSKSAELGLPDYDDGAMATMREMIRMALALDGGEARDNPPSHDGRAQCHGCGSTGRGHLLNCASLLRIP